LAVLRPRKINNLHVVNGLLGFNSPLQHQALQGLSPRWRPLLALPKKALQQSS